MTLPTTPPSLLAHTGESFAEGCAREVREETGIDCEFRSILTFWHRHGLTWNKSDICASPRHNSMALVPLCRASLHCLFCIHSSRLCSLIAVPSLLLLSVNARGTDVVCLMHPSQSSQPIHLDPGEISECRWMPLEEVVTTQDHPLILRICDSLFPKASSLNRIPMREEPTVSIQEVPVQWPGRPAIPTFIACGNGADAPSSSPSK